MQAPACSSPEEVAAAGGGIPLREFFGRFGIPIHSMVVDGAEVDVDKMRVFGFTPERADGSPDESGFIPVPMAAGG